jgi:hypothetical protein
MATAEITAERRQTSDVARRVIPPTLVAEVAGGAAGGSDGNGESLKFIRHLTLIIACNILNNK